MVRRIVLTVLALAVVLPSMAFARGRYLCEVDHIERESCCCPPKKASHDAVPLPHMQRDCCKIVQHSTSPPPVATPEAASYVAASVAIVATTLAPAVPAREARAAISSRAQAPPPLGSLFARRSSLLL